MSPNDISKLFTDYVRGELPAIPWSEDPLAAETVTIQKHLIGLNQSGRWTVGSQPAVDGVESADEVFGWGPKGGYIFQKSFVEFFTTEKEWERIREKIKDDLNISFYAGNNKVRTLDEGNLGKGGFMTNMEESAANTVTWGVFPGKEIVQPTIIEEVSFRNWKVPSCFVSRADFRTKHLQYGTNGPNYTPSNHPPRNFFAKSRINIG